MKLFLSNKVYGKEAVLKASYMMKEDFSFFIDVDADYFILNFTALNDKSFNETKFMDSINEQQLRETLNDEFGELRNQIYAKAFSIVK